MMNCPYLLYNVNDELSFVRSERSWELTDKDEEQLKIPEMKVVS